MNMFGIVGCGKMGQALSLSILPALDCPCLCCDTSQTALRDFAANCAHLQLPHSPILTTDIRDVAKQCSTVLVAVKPIHAQAVLQALSNGCEKNILSIVAGLSLEKLTQYAKSPRCIRIMPNTPALVGAGAIVILDNALDENQKQWLTQIFAHAGSCHFIADESALDAVTALSGSSPALFAILSEALTDAAVAEGLPRSLAAKLARETMLGTAKLLEQQHPAILKENVMSPGGTTAAGVIAAENNGLRAAAQAFIAAATQKSRQLS